MLSLPSGIKPSPMNGNRGKNSLFYWQFYWLFFVIYLALHVPLETEKAYYELDGYDVRYFHHIFGHYFWLARHVLLGQSSKKSFCSGCSCVNQPKIIRQSHLQFQRRIQQEIFHLSTKKVEVSCPCLTILFVFFISSKLF